MASSLLNKAVKLRPDNLAAQLKLARLYVDNGVFKQAREVVLKVLAKEPENAEALLVLAQTAYSPQEAGHVLQILQGLPQQLGSDAGYHLALGTTYLRLPDLDKAEAELNNALQLDAKSSDVQLGLADLYLARTNFAKAEEAFKRATELAPPRSRVPLLYAGFIATIHTNLQEARQLVEAVTKKTPDYLPAWLSLARLAIAQTNYTEA